MGWGHRVQRQQKEAGTAPCGPPSSAPSGTPRCSNVQPCIGRTPSGAAHPRHPPASSRRDWSTASHAGRRCPCICVSTCRRFLAAAGDGYEYCNVRVTRRTKHQAHEEMVPRKSLARRWSSQSVVPPPTPEGPAVQGERLCVRAAAPGSQRSIPYRIAVFGDQKAHVQSNADRGLI